MKSFPETLEICQILIGKTGRSSSNKT